jgi:DNA-binding transcriptional ArsR family regulator
VSLEATNIVWASKLTGSRKLLLLRLADYADKDGGSVYPSVQSLAAACGLSERAVQYTRRALEEEGLLVVVANAKGGRGKAREYRIDLERVQSITSVKGADIARKGASHSTKGCNTTQERVQPGAPHPPEEPPEEPVTPIAPPPVRLDELAEAVAEWNAMAADCGLAKVQILSDTRKAALRRRLTEAGGIEGWRYVMGKIRGSPWMHGTNDRGWRADFDFVLKPAKFIKLMEGGYDHRQRPDSDQEYRNPFAAIRAAAGG